MKPPNAPNDPLSPSLLAEKNKTDDTTAPESTIEPVVLPKGLILPAGRPESEKSEPPSVRLTSPYIRQPT